MGKFDNITKVYNDEKDVVYRPIDPESASELQNVDEHFFCQWSIENGMTYRPATKTVSTLPPGRYITNRDNYGFKLTKQKVSDSELIRFPNTVADAIISEFESFWEKKDEYLKRGEPHKRGFVLWGPAGGGKTSTVQLIVKNFIANNGVVFDFSFDTVEALNSFRLVEANRKMMVIIEDIDIFVEHGDMEQRLLLFLDGGVQHKNTVMIATTNYPEDLPDRIINRPSRFDRISYLGATTEEERLEYFKQKCQTTPESVYKKWVKATEDWTFAHIKELIISVEVNSLPYKETLVRLNHMRSKKSSSSDYEKEMRGKAGYGFGKQDNC